VNVLVTGHAGFLGQHIGRSLSAEGIEWTGLDRIPSVSAKKQIICDVRSLPVIAGRLPDFELIIHLASPVGVTDTSAQHAGTYKAIVEGANAVTGIALRMRARLIYFSSSEVFGEAGRVIDHSTPLAPLSGYGRGKQAAERLVASLLDNAVVVRPFNVYGPGQRSGFLVANIIRQLQCNGTIQLVGGGRAIRQFTYVGDVVEAVRRIRHGWPPARQTVHIAGPEAATVAHVVETAACVAGRPISTVVAAAEDLDRDPDVEICMRTVVPDTIGGWAPSTTIAAGLGLTLAATCHSRCDSKPMQQ
jgi:nucleoside-diphosphate-sugar epimerase